MPALALALPPMLVTGDATATPSGGKEVWRSGWLVSEMLLTLEGLRRLRGADSLPMVILDALPDVLMGGGPVGGRFLGRDRFGR